MATSTPGLTSRELGVRRLVAVGLSDAKVAEQLHRRRHVRPPTPDRVIETGRRVKI
jgi:hypothetical protein